MDRRQFLRLSAGGVAASLTSAACGVDAGLDLEAFAQPELLAVLDAAAVREIGIRYREMVPAEGEATALHAAILASRPWSWRLPGARRTVSELVRNDFAEGRTVLVDGWVLSATEARQCALHSLLRP